MGMLDEAIREHFDLMRRNGADPAVVAIEEREALGDPAQREARAAEIAAESSGETHVEAVTISAEADGVVVAEVAEETYEEPATQVIAPEGGGEDPVASEEVEAVVVTEEEIAVEPVPTVVEEGQFASETPEQETRGFTIEESQEAVMPPARPVGAPPAAQDPAAAPGPGAEAAEGELSDEARDELEQTPEFLEETPEHDRLWFERKPPRDFEF